MLEKDTLMNLESFVAETPSVQKNRKEKTHTHTTPSQNKNFVTLFAPKEIQPKGKQRINNATFEEWLKLVYPYCIAEFHLYMCKHVQIILRWLVSLEFL